MTEEGCHILRDAAPIAFWSLSTNFSTGHCTFTNRDLRAFHTLHYLSYIHKREENKIIF